MQASMFSHDRSLSPTVRRVVRDTGVRFDEPSPPVRPTSMPQRMSSQLSAERIPDMQLHPVRVVESTSPGKSFTTFTWRVEPQDNVPLEHAHTRLDHAHLHSVTLPTVRSDKLKQTWGGTPVTHCFETTESALMRDLAGKEPVERTAQSFDNCENESNRLKQKYLGFSANAKALLRGSSAHPLEKSSGLPLPLTQIIKSVWPTLRFKDQAERQAWLERTRDNPTVFIAQSYDALSLALGRVAVALPLAKRGAAEALESATEAQRSAIAQKARNADRAFAETRRVFDAIGFPIDRALLKGHSILAEYSKPSC